MAVASRRPASGTIHHSAQGAQYTSLSFGQHLQRAGLVGSMGSTRDAYDNAAMESFFVTLQTELLDREAWESRSGLRSAIFRFVKGFYKRRRRHTALGYISPVEFEVRYARGRLLPDGGSRYRSAKSEQLQLRPTRMMKRGFCLRR